MNHKQIIEQLAVNRLIFSSLLKGKSKAEYLWKPKEKKWCLLEIVCHLYDEEIEDFRTRVKHTLEAPGTPPPPIDPVNWVLSRNYMEMNYNKMVARFLEERSKSIEWLQSLQNPNWSNSYKHPELGTLSSEHFLYNWLAHDILHFRQINRLQFQYLKSHSHHDLAYAGNW